MVAGRSDLGRKGFRKECTEGIQWLSIICDYGKMLKFIHKFLSSPVCTSNIVAITKDKVFLENNVYKSTLVFTIALDLIQLCWSCNLWGTMWNQSWKWVTSDTQTQPHKFPRLKSALDKCHWGTLYGWRGSAQLFAGFRVQVVFSIC